MRYSLAPFGDSQVGAVGTLKRVRRRCSSTSCSALCGYLANVYYEFSNHDNKATNFTDASAVLTGGVTVRTCVLTDWYFLDALLNEYYFFVRVGPLSANVDHFLTCWRMETGQDHRKITHHV